MDTTAHISTPDLTTKPNASYGELVDYWNKGHASGFFPTSTPEMIEELQAQNERLYGERSGFENRIAELQEEVDRVSRISSSYIDHKIFLERQIESFMEGLMQFVVDGEIEEAVGEELAGYFNRDLTRRVSIHVRAEGDVEVMVPLGYNIDELESDLSVVIDNINYSDIDIEYADIQLVEVEVQ